MKKVTVVLDTPEWEVHFGTALEILQERINAGDQVSVLICDNEVTACESNYDHSLDQCFDCKARRDFGLSLIEGNFTRRSMSEFYKGISLKSVADFMKSLDHDPKKLRYLKIDNFEIGEAVLSSISSRYAREWPTFEEFGDLLRRFLFSCFMTYHGIRNYLKKFPDEEIVFFNGRMALQRAMMRGAEIEKAKFVVHERGRNKNHYKLYQNISPHSFEGINQEIEEAWEFADPTTREKIAEDWYLALSNGVPQTFVSFVSLMNVTDMPSGWDDKKENIVFFTSAEYESNFLGSEWAHPIYLNQNDGVQRIVKAFEGVERLHFYIRLHPSLKGKTWETETLMNIRQKNVTVIPAESPLHSYALLRAAHKVLVFASTIGIEAAYWGKPVIVAGRAQYEDIGSTYTPRTHDDLIALVGQKLEAKPRLGALKYAYYYARLGEPFKYYQPNDLFGGKFKGQIFHESEEARKFRSRPAFVRRILNVSYLLWTKLKLKRLLD